MSHQIEPDALKALIDRDAVKVIDGSWALDGTDMHALFLSDHIAGAQFFDIEAVSDHSTPLPHMAPSPDVFAQAVGKMGISAGDAVVVYDRQGLFSAARVWWTFKLMGHRDVRVLRGGLPAWKAAGLPIASTVATPVATTYAPQFQNQMVMNLRDLRAYLDANDVRVLDARPYGRFTGEAPEPRPGLRSGHMPGSRSLPASDLIRYGALKPTEELRQMLAERGVDSNSEVVTSCGSGVTAAIISLALAETGHSRAALYDGSWAEWGQTDLDTPVVTGA